MAVVGIPGVISYRGTGLTGISSVYAIAVMNPDVVIEICRVTIGYDQSGSNDPPASGRQQVRLSTATLTSSPTAKTTAVSYLTSGSSSRMSMTTVLYTGEGGAISTSSDVTLFEGDFGLEGFDYRPLEDERIRISPGKILTIFLPVAPAAAVDLFLNVVVKEFQ